MLAHPEKRYLRSADNTWTDTGEPFNDINWNFIQLPAFNKSLDELKTDLDRWLFLFNNLENLTERPRGFDHPAFKKLFDITNISKLSRKEKEMFTLTIDGDRDWRNAISHARREGQEESNRQVVRSLIRRTDFNNEKIAELVSVSVDFVRSIRAKS